MLQHQFERITNIQYESLLCIMPMRKRQITSQYICRNHPRKIDRILCTSKLRSIAKLSFLKIINGRAQLNHGRKNIYSFIHTIHPKGLRA